MRNGKTRTGASATQRNSALSAKAFASGRVLVNRTGLAVAVVIVAACSSSLEGARDGGPIDTGGRARRRHRAARPAGSGLSGEREGPAPASCAAQRVPAAGAGSSLRAGLEEPSPRWHHGAWPNCASSASNRLRRDDRARLAALPRRQSRARPGGPHLVGFAAVVPVCRDATTAPCARAASRAWPWRRRTGDAGWAAESWPRSSGSSATTTSSGPAGKLCRSTGLRGWWPRRGRTLPATAGDSVRTAYEDDCVFVRPVIALQLSGDLSPRSRRRRVVIRAGLPARITTRDQVCGYRW